MQYFDLVRGIVVLIADAENHILPAVTAMCSTSLITFFLTNMEQQIIIILKYLMHYFFFVRGIVEILVNFRHY